MPDNADYDDLRIGSLLRIDRYYPSFIVNASNIDDIRSTVHCASIHGVELTIKNGGHSFEGFSNSFGIILSLDYYSDIIEYNISNEASFVKIQSGMRLARLYGLIVQLFDADHYNMPFVIAGGTCPTVGVTGHILCGGNVLNLYNYQLSVILLSLSNPSFLLTASPMFGRVWFIWT